MKASACYPVAVAIALLTGGLDVSAQPAKVPDDLEKALRSNQDKVEFSSFQVERTGNGEEGPFVCGTMNVKIWPPGGPTFMPAKFVATFYSGDNVRIFGRSWVNVYAPVLLAAGKERYEQFCK